MGSFALEMSSPFASGGGAFHGGPHKGGHHGPHWFNEFGMDLGAPGGTEVRAVFDGKITKLDTSKIGLSSGSEYGAQIFVRAQTPTLNPDALGGVGAFYTHLKDLRPGITNGASIHRGDVLGVVVGAQLPHLHLAISERRNGTNFGVNLYDLFQATINTTAPTTVHFPQDGSPPHI